MVKKNKKIKHFLFLILVFISSSAFAQEDIKITEIQFDKPEKTFQLGSFKLDYKILPENATNKTLTWESDNPDVVAVRDGTIAVRKVGRATITATAQDGSGVSSKITIIGVKLIQKISFDLGTVIQLRPDGAKNQPLHVTIEPSDATNQTLTWTSSDATVVSVTDKGEITTHKVGSADIRATAQDGSFEYAVLHIDVIIPVEKVIINEGDITLPIYSSKQLTATILPADAPIRTVHWSSSNRQVATIDGNGLVSARGSIGETIITASSDDEDAGYPEAHITVKVVNSPVSDLVILPYQRDMELKWQPSATETDWQVIYNEKGSADKITKFTKTPSIILRDLKPKTVYEVQVSAIVNNQPTSLAAIKEAQTAALSEGNKFPHLYNIKNIKLNEPFAVIWKDMEDAATKVNFQLRNSGNDALVTDVLQVNDGERMITINKSGSYRLIVTFTNNQQAWEEISYDLNIK